MSDKLENALAGVIEKANSGIDAATEFVMSELPEVIQQALTWYAIESLIYFLIGCMMSLLSIKVIRKQVSFIKTCDGVARWARWSELDHDLNPPACAYVFFCVVIDLACFIAAFSFLLNWDWLKIWIAPKLWLIEYAAKLAS